MATDWSDNIIVCDLADEPSLSEELNGLLARLEQNGDTRHSSVVVNMADVTYLNSSNIAQLLRAQGSERSRRASEDRRHATPCGRS